MSKRRSWKYQRNVHSYLTQDLAKAAEVKPTKPQTCGSCLLWQQATKDKGTCEYRRLIGGRSYLVSPNRQRPLDCKSYQRKEQ